MMAEVKISRVVGAQGVVFFSSSSLGEAFLAALTKDRQ